MSGRRLRGERATLVAAGSALALFLALPLLGLVLTTSSADFLAGLGHPLVWPALRLSLFTTAISLLLVVGLGTPLAYVIARQHRASTRALEVLVQLPIVVPPAVAGVALLLAFGRHGLVARLFPGHEPSIAFTTTAVVLAEVFVSAPFFVQAAISAFRRVDPRLILVARSFGATPLSVLFRVALPLAAQGLLAGAAMSFARSLGEFGATLMFAGNLEGVTQTLPLAIYSALESDLRAAQALSIVLLLLSFGLLFFVRGVVGRSLGGAERES